MLDCALAALLSDYVVHDGLGGRVVIHKAGCVLLDGRYDDGGERRVCESFSGAKEIAQRIAGPAFFTCGWCRPEPAH